MKSQSNHASARFANKLFIAAIFLIALFALLQTNSTSANSKPVLHQPISQNYFNDLIQEPLLQEPNSLAATPNTWTSNGPSRDLINSLFIDPHNSTILYAFGSNQYKSTDSGDSWVSFGPNIKILAIDPANWL
jgi:hypothetical protein